MAPRRRIVRPTLLSATITESVRANNRRSRLELQSWSHLPSELLEPIMSRLTTEDNFRASEACRTWHLSAMSVRVPSPLIIIFPKSLNDLVEFYDPLRRKSLFFRIPLLWDCNVVCCKYGWLLLINIRNCNLFFFNPFTRRVIRLPSPKTINVMHRVAFSAPPTSLSCIVCVVTPFSSTITTMSTYKFSSGKWKSSVFRNTGTSPDCFFKPKWNNLVFCRGLFYAIDSAGFIWAFDPNNLILYRLNMPPPDDRISTIPASRRSSVKYMVEHEGSIYVLITGNKIRPRIIKVDVNNHHAREVTNIGNLTIFASLVSSHVGVDVPGYIKNTIYFSKIRPLGKKCVRYSLDDRRYYPNRKGYNWDIENPCGGVWIQPPYDLSEFMRDVERVEQY